MRFNINTLLRPNIKDLSPYSSARNEYSGDAAIFLDANENPFESGLNRYPDPLQRELKERIAEKKKVAVENIFLGNGSDEPIDLLFRAFCEPGYNNVVSIKPTYGMYKVCADINNTEFRESLLTKEFDINVEDLLAKTDENSKLIFLCSPNNPTSNILKKTAIINLLEKFRGLVILDEAYIDFSSNQSMLAELKNYPNLVVLQTFSKAWGMAGIRLGMAYASLGIVNVLNKIKYPYNINILTQREALKHILREDRKDIEVAEIIEQREFLNEELTSLSVTEKILPSETNFLMVRMKDAQQIFKYLLDKKIIIRDRSKVALCEGFLRITVGTKAENKSLIEALKTYK